MSRSGARHMRRRLSSRQGGQRARVDGDDLGLAQMRCVAGLGRELLGELAEHQMLGPLLDQGDRCDVPEGGGTAVSEHYLIALGEREEIGEACPHSADQALDRLLPVRGAQHGAVGGGQCIDLLIADPGRTGTEPTVRRQQLLRDGQGADLLGARGAGITHRGSPRGGSAVDVSDASTAGSTILPATTAGGGAQESSRRFTVRRRSIGPRSDGRRHSCVRRAGSGDARSPPVLAGSDHEPCRSRQEAL